MNDKELNKNIKKSFENFIKKLAENPEEVFDNNALQIKYNNVLKEKIKLQSNWNSLKEWIKENSWYYNTSDGCQWVDQFKLLDKMNELEGVDND